MKIRSDSTMKYVFFCSILFIINFQHLLQKAILQANFCVCAGGILVLMSAAQRQEKYFNIPCEVCMSDRTDAAKYIKPPFVATDYKIYKE